MALPTVQCLVAFVLSDVLVNHGHSHVLLVSRDSLAFLWCVCVYFPL